MGQSQSFLKIDVHFLNDNDFLLRVDTEARDMGHGQRDLVKSWNEDPPQWWWLGGGGFRPGTGVLWPSSQGQDPQQGGESIEDRGRGKASLPGPLHTNRDKWASGELRYRQVHL